MQMQARWASVAVARPLREALTYAIPVGMSGSVGVGHVVAVPLGRTLETGYVVALLDDPGMPPEKVKPIAQLVDTVPAFDAGQLTFFRWIADYYLAPLGMVIRTAIPSEVRTRSVRVLGSTDAGADALATGMVEGAEAGVLREIISRPGLTRRGMVRRLEAEIDPAVCERAIDALVRKQLAVWSEKELKGPGGKVATVSLAVPLQDALDKVGASAARARARAVLTRLGQEGGPVDIDVIVAEHGEAARAGLRTLVTAGLVTRSEREDRDPLLFAPANGPAVAPNLNDDQRAALDVLRADGAQGPHLLFGVTGSGKTEVFLGAADAVLARGRQVCVLVPEIGLTPQLVGRFRARFGESIAVLHSGLGAGERLQQWRRIRAGEARVAVGARSALFAPFQALGLVVVDEEHDDSYKQSDGVRYNARDLAVVLAARWSAPVVLASATPSLESWHRARHGKYVMLRLPNRATARPVPIVELVDMTEVPKGDDGDRPMFAPAVVTALRDTFDAGGKAIVLYNRRGYATLLQCGSCGASFECPSCGISLTLHRAIRTLACHYCGFKRPVPPACPACGKPELAEMGKGTERIEAVLAGLFPDIPIARMDADTTTAKGSHQRILDAFRDGETRLLVGTQIVAKGHDFPDVHTAVVVSADAGLRLPDFRASERTFSLLVQVAGRAGRGDVPGRVFVQTWKPDHPVLENLDDVETFLEREARQRKVLRYPPWTHLVLITLEGVDRRGVSHAAATLVRALRPRLPAGGDPEILGPALAAMPRLVGRWRFHVLIRATDRTALRRWLTSVRDVIDAPPGPGVRMHVDVDPRDLM